jgi:hypothetical protein
MKPSKPLVSDVISMRALEYSADGNNVTISLTTKYSSERFFSVPLSCLSELIADLENLKRRGAAPESASGAQNKASAQPADVRTDAAAKPAGNQVNIAVPKKWMLASGLPNHPLVILILDAQTKTQAGFGFSDRAAREMAAGLVKYADLISNHSAAGSKLK